MAQILHLAFLSCTKLLCFDDLAKCAGRLEHVRRYLFYCHIPSEQSQLSNWPKHLDMAQSLWVVGLNCDLHVFLRHLSRGCYVQGLSCQALVIIHLWIQRFRNVSNCLQLASRTAIHHSWFLYRYIFPRFFLEDFAAEKPIFQKAPALSSAQQSGSLCHCPARRSSLLGSLVPVQKGRKLRSQTNISQHFPLKHRFCWFLWRSKLVQHFPNIFHSVVFEFFDLLQVAAAVRASGGPWSLHRNNPQSQRASKCLEMPQPSKCPKHRNGANGVGFKLLNSKCPGPLHWHTPWCRRTDAPVQEMSRRCRL